MHLFSLRSLKPTTLLALPALGIGLLWGMNVSAQKSTSSPKDTSKVAQEALAILKQNCFTCHSGEKPMGGLRLTSRADILKGGASGTALTLAKPDESLLLKAVRFQGRQMPPAGKLGFQQIETLSQWVRLGAPMTPSKESDTHPSGPPQVKIGRAHV